MQPLKIIMSKYSSTRSTYLGIANFFSCQDVTIVKYVAFQADHGKAVCGCTVL